MASRGAMVPPPAGGYGPSKAMGAPPSTNTLPPPPLPPRSVPYPETCVEVNEVGLPIRPGKEHCLVYMNTGICQNGMACIFDHPRGLVSPGTLPKGGGAPPPLPGMDGPKLLPPPGGLGGPPPGPGLGGPPGLGMPPPAMPKEGGMPPLPVPGEPGSMPLPPPGPVGPGQDSSPPGLEAPNSSAPPAGGDTAAKEEGDDGEKKGDLPAPPPKPVPTQLEYTDEGLPIRPGAQKCGFYLRSGHCTYGPNCRYDHPAGLGGILSGPQGFGNFPLFCQPAEGNEREVVLARRPGKDQCPFLARTGTCPFGPECRFDHIKSSGDNPPPKPPPTPAGAAKLPVKKDRGLGGAKGKRPQTTHTGFRRP